ncbi:MAG TPA: hypothetical protein PLO28_05265 [bacterium]|nr:hypothetical protein [bacterium]
MDLFFFALIHAAKSIEIMAKSQAIFAKLLFYIDSNEWDRASSPPPPQISLDLGAPILYIEKKMAPSAPPRQKRRAADPIMER